MSTREQFFVGTNKAPSSLGTRKLLSASGLSTLPIGVRTTPTLNTSTYTTVLSITGSGAINTLCWLNNYGATHSMDVKVTIDGVLLINDTLSVTNTAAGIAIGTDTYGSTSKVVPEPDIYFKNSLLIEAKDTSNSYSPVWAINYKVF